MKKIKNLNVYTIIIMAILVVFVIIGSVFLSGIVKDPPPIVDNFYKIGLSGAVQGGYMQKYEHFKVGAELELPIVKVEGGNALVEYFHYRDNLNVSQPSVQNKYYRINTELKDVAKITVVYDKYLYYNDNPIAEITFPNVTTLLDENNFYAILFELSKNDAMNCIMFDDSYFEDVYGMQMRNFEVQYAIIYEVPENTRFYMSGYNGLVDHTGATIKQIK